MHNCVNLCNSDMEYLICHVVNEFTVSNYISPINFSPFVYIIQHGVTSVFDAPIFEKAIIYA